LALEHAGFAVRDAFDSDEAASIARASGSGCVLVLGAELLSLPGGGAAWLRLKREVPRLALAVVSRGEALPAALKRLRSALVLENPFDGAAIARAAHTALARVRPVRRGPDAEQRAAI
jgi:hypothetical protein